MPELESAMEPEYDSDSFKYCTPVADNEDDGYMSFVQYLSL